MVTGFTLPRPTAAVTGCTVRRGARHGGSRECRRTEWGRSPAPARPGSGAADIKPQECGALRPLAARRHPLASRATASHREQAASVTKHDRAGSRDRMLASAACVRALAARPGDFSPSRCHWLPLAAAPLRATPRHCRTQYRGSGPWHVCQQAMPMRRAPRGAAASEESSQCAGGGRRRGFCAMFL